MVQAKLFLDLYLAKFLDTSVNPRFFRVYLAKDALLR